MNYLQLAYVYYHVRNDDNSIFYVGKGTNNRAYNISQRSVYWKNIVKKAGGFSVHILASNLSNKEALNFEKLIIQKLKDLKVSLCNLTDGGEGLLNPSKETKERMSQAKLGKSLSETHKINIAKGGQGLQKKKGWKLTPEQIENRRRAQIGAKRSKEACLNISEAKLAKKYKHSEATKLKMSLAKQRKNKESIL